MSDKPKNPEQSSTYIAECDHMKVNLINAGKFIELADAVKYLQGYFDEPGTPPRTDPKHIYGHTFGLNNFRTILYHIDQYNSNAKPGQLRIAAMRFYYAADERTDRDFPMRPPHKKYRDLIFMPVLENGVDLYPVDHKLDNGEMILSGGRPCPNQCSLTFYDKVEKSARK